MKVTKYDGREARRILRAMILDPTVCARVAGKWEPAGLFADQWANLIAGWVVKHYNRYGQPPNGQMTAIYERWADTTPADTATVEAVEAFLRGLSGDFDDNPDCVLDAAAAYFTRVRTEDAIRRATVDLQRGDIAEALTKLGSLRRVELGNGSYLEPADDFGPWEAAFHRQRGITAFDYRGDLGAYVGDSFQRGRFFSYMAPDKVGKTTWLVDASYRAVRAGRRVAFFDVGDGSEDEFFVRLGIRASGHPELAGEYEIPQGWDEDGNLITATEELPAVTPGCAYQAFRRVARRPDALRAICYPSGVLSADGLDGVLSDWAADGWIPDVVLVDYADILAPPSGVRDKLDQIDETWMRLRRISQSRHCLLLTATQTSALAYGSKGLMSRKHFGGRKTKLAHVNGMLGINVTPEEKDQGIARINWVVLRGRAFSEQACVRVAGNMAVGNPALASQR